MSLWKIEHDQVMPCDSAGANDNIVFGARQFSAKYALALQSIFECAARHG
jgi:hypothetical protein